MAIILNILITIIVALITTVSFRYFRIIRYKFLYGPNKKTSGKIKIFRANGSDKVYAVILKTNKKKWIHPTDSLDILGYHLVEDVEQVDRSVLDKYKESGDINLMY